MGCAGSICCAHSRILGLDERKIAKASRKCGARIAARHRGVDSRRPGHGQRSGRRTRRPGDAGRHGLPRRKAPRSAGPRLLHRGPDLSQADRRSDHAQRSGKPADGFRAVADRRGRPLDRRGKARCEHLGLAALHDGRGARASVDAPFQRNRTRVPRAASRNSGCRRARSTPAGRGARRWPGEFRSSRGHFDRRQPFLDPRLPA
jgi:hypothetical protein